MVALLAPADGGLRFCWWWLVCLMLGVMVLVVVDELRVMSIISFGCVVSLSSVGAGGFRLITARQESRGTGGPRPQRPRNTGDKAALPPVSRLTPELLGSANAGQPDERCRQDSSGPSRDLPRADRHRGGQAERRGDRQTDDLADTRKRLPGPPVVMSPLPLGQGNGSLSTHAGTTTPLVAAWRTPRQAPACSAGVPLAWIVATRFRDEGLPGPSGLTALPA